MSSLEARADPRRSASRDEPDDQPAEAIAIVGMACAFAGACDLAAYWRNIARGTPLDASSAASGGAGCAGLWRIVGAALEDAAGGSGAMPATGLAFFLSGVPAEDAGAPPFGSADLDVCPSSIEGISRAVRRLLDGSCDVGVVASGQAGLGGAHALGSSDRIKPYARTADGVIASHGLGAIVLKRLGDAERDGDRIYALVAGIGQSPDRLTALQDAYAQGGVDPASIGLIEGEGAATVTADAEELAVLHEIFGKDGFPEVALGAASSTVGAVGEAAALAGVIKAALALYHRALPPTPDAAAPHPDIQTSRLYVSDRLRPWISLTDVRRRVGVSTGGVSEGGSGRCGHIVLEESTAGFRPSWRSFTPWRSEMIVIAAATHAALRDEIARVQRIIAKDFDDGRLGQLAFTLARRFSETHHFRLTTVVRTVADLALRLALAGDRLSHDATDSWRGYAETYFSTAPYAGKIGFLFPGVGFPGLAGGYADRLGELALHFPDMLGWLDRAETITADDDVSYKLSFQLFPPPYCALDTLAEIEEQLKWSQRASAGTMIANLATYSLVRALGISADAMAGFSLGEWSALVAGGIIDMETASGTTQPTPETAARNEIEAESYRGSWAMVSASADDIEAVIHTLGDEVTVTIDVSPDQAFIGGEEFAVQAAIELLRAAGIWASAIPSSPLMASFSAFHTKHAAGHGEQLNKTLSAMPLKRLDRPIYSSVNARLFPSEPEEIVKILVQNVTDTVRVRDTIATMHRNGIRIFLQLGGGGRLLSTVQKNLALEPHVALSIDVEYLPGLEQLQLVLAQLLALGVPFNPLPLYQYRALGDLDLDGIAVAPPAPHRFDALPSPAPKPSPPFVSPLVSEAPLSEALDTGALDSEALAGLARLFEIERRSEAALTGLLTRFLEQQRPRLPDSASGLLGRIVEIEPGVRLASRLVLDLAIHRFLGEHVLLAVPDSLKPARDLLPTLPFAFAVEILAQAAQALVPAQTVLDCHDLEARSWIALHGTDTLALLVVAKTISPHEVDVEITIEGDAKPAMRGRIAMGRALPAAAPMVPGGVAPEGLARCPLTAAEYYDEGPLFQGKLFRAITALHTMSEAAITGEVILRDPRDVVARSTAAPIFDAILIDSVAQMMGVPAWIKDRRFLVPIRVKRIARHNPLPRPGSRAQARIATSRLDERRTQADFDITGPAGELLLRVEGWEELWMIWPKALLARNHQPREGSIGRPWNAGSADLSCYRTSLEDFGQVDPAWIARYYLTAGEFEQFQRTQRTDWLLGRIAVKDAVRDWYRRHRRVALHPLEVEIANLPGGAPLLLSPADGPVSISIAHLADQAVAVASSVDCVGIDIVRMSDRDAGFLNLAFDRRELACLPQTDPDRMAWANRAWCAKEASAKACGRGYDTLPQFRVQRLGWDDGVIEIADELHDCTADVATLLDGDHVVALSRMRHVPALVAAPS